MNLIAGVDGCSWCISIYVLKSFPRRGLVRLPLFPDAILSSVDHSCIGHFHDTVLAVLKIQETVVQ